MTTIVGLKAVDGVVLASDRRASKGFFIASKTTQKIMKVDESLAIAVAGLLSDAVYLVNVVRAERKLIALRRGYPLSVAESSKLISNLFYSGLRSYIPYYAELIVAGVDDEGPHVFSSDMSGSMVAEEFVSSGSGSPVAYGVLESLYSPGLRLEEARAIAVKAVEAAMQRDPGSGNGVDVLAIPVRGG
ncbi:MAG: proteasome subunit beta [Candidatus Caldarchaeum sp.]|nr:proteasome subunit beta [Candidatus Caldarchaeales archaeon]